jgi:ABC-type multidrug transport system fused ATPase/permease subunit
MARPIPYESNLKAWSSTGESRRVLRGLTIGLIISVLISAGVWVLSTSVDSKMFGEENAAARFCQWLYDSEIGTGIRESIWVFPIIEGAHLLGIALSVGMLCWFDLRLMGLTLRDEPVSKVWRQVMPASFIGFALMFVTGLLLFWAEAITAYHSVHFWAKILLLVLAGVNALSFEATAHRNMAEWDKAPVPPLRARVTGAVSLILWTAIIVTGRTMAYNF